MLRLLLFSLLWQLKHYISCSGNPNPARWHIWARISWAEFFSGKLHFLFCWLNIDLPFKPLWWYYSVKLIFLLVFLEPLKISYVVRNNLSLIKRGIELFWFFNLELWFICHLTVRRNRWIILRSFFVNSLLPLLLVFLRGFDLNQHSAKKFRTQTGI